MHFLIFTACSPTKYKIKQMENNKINLLREVLAVRNYAPKTIAIYLTAINKFFSFSNQSSQSQISKIKNPFDSF